MTRARKFLTAAAAVVALSVVGLVVASASQLNVSGGYLSLQNVLRCTNATIATTGFRIGWGTSWNRVRLVGVPETCAGLPITVFVYGTSGQLSTGTVISLRSFQDGQYVTAAGTASALISDSWTNGTNQQFDLTINDDGTVSLRARSVTRYVTVDGTNSQLYANSTTIGTSQKFNLITNADGTIALKSLLTGFQVCAEDAGASPLIANRDWIQEWEKFYLIID